MMVSMTSIFFPRLTRPDNDHHGLRRGMTTTMTNARPVKKRDGPKQKWTSTVLVGYRRKRLAPHCWWWREKRLVEQGKKIEIKKRMVDSWDRKSSIIVIIGLLRYGRLIMRVALYHHLGGCWEADKNLAHSHVLSVRSVFNQQPKETGQEKGPNSASNRACVGGSFVSSFFLFSTDRKLFDVSVNTFNVARRVQKERDTGYRFQNGWMVQIFDCQLHRDRAK